MAASQNTRIILIGTQMEVAGAQRMLLSQARWFLQRGYDVTALFVYDKQGLAERWRTDYDVPIDSLDGWKLNTFGLLNLFSLLAALTRMFLKLRGAQVVVAYTPHSNLLGLPIAWLARVPVRIGTHHGHIEGSSRFLQRLHGWLTNSRVCRTMVAVSAQVRDYAIRTEGARAEKVVVIENGIEPVPNPFPDKLQRYEYRRQLGVGENELMFLTVGRLTVQKGHTVLLDAVAKQKSGVAARYLFAGDGPQRPLLEEQARRLGISTQIFFLGVRADIPELLWAADVFVQPSLWEGLSLALLEALFSARPVLATQVEGVVDVVEHEKSALLVPINDPYALATALDRLATDADLRRRLGSAGQQRAEAGYSIDKMCGAYENLILGLLNG